MENKTPGETGNILPQSKHRYRRIVIVTILMLIGLNTYAQNKRYNISVKKETLENVLNQLREKYDINIIYNHEILLDYQNVSIELTNATIEEVLSEALKNTKLTFSLTNNTIVIIPIKEKSEPNEKQNLSQIVRGAIFDIDSKTPLIGATIYILNTNPLLGAATDLDGHFIIEKVPIGRYSIKVTYVGYEEIIIPEISVGAGKEVVINLELKEATGVLNEVVVIAKTSKGEALNTMVTVSGRSFTVDEASRYAGSFSDPARMASAFAGVVSNNGFNNEITVRGNSPKGLLWRLEGVEIPSPNHLQGYSRNGGVVTVLSTNVMANSDFLTGAFPSEYGNATSGVFDIKLRSGNEQKHEYAFQASLFGIEAAAEGPLQQGSKASYLFNYRYATTSLFGNIGLLDKNDGLPAWQDMNLKLNMPTKKLGTFQFFAIGGLSGVTEAAQKDSLKWIMETDNQNSKFHSNMGVIGLSNQIKVGKSAYFKTVIAVTGRGTGGSSDSLDHEYQTHFNGYSKTVDYSSVLSTFVNIKVKANSVIRGGLISTHKEFNLYAEDINPVAPYTLTKLVDSNGSINTLQPYAQWKYSFTPRLELNTGFHGFYTSFNSNFHIQPRAALKWDIDNQQSINFGYGRHSRLEAATIYYEEVNINGVVSKPNQSLDLAQSNHYVISYDLLLGEHMRLKLETYYQKQKDIPIVDDATSSYSTVNTESPITGYALVNKGTASNKGIELTLEKYFDNQYYFMLTGSLYDAKYTAGDGIERSTRYNGRYVTNFAAGKEFSLKNNRVFGIDIRCVLAGGSRITPINLEQSKLNNTTIYYTDQAFSQQAPAYFRPDVKFSLTKNKGRTKRILSLDIQNVSNQQNILMPYYDKRKGDIVTTYQFGILPNISYRIQF